MKRLPREPRDGTTSRLKNLSSITGRNPQLISTILPSSRPPNLLFPRLPTLTKPMLSAVSETRSPLTTFHLPEVSPKIHLLPDISEKKESRILISTLMVPEEEMIKSWQEELSLTLE